MLSPPDAATPDPHPDQDSRVVADRLALTLRLGRGERARPTLFAELAVLTPAGDVTEDGGVLRWEPADPLADDELLAAIDDLRGLASELLPTDEHGRLAPQIDYAAAFVRERALSVGEALTDALLAGGKAARKRLEGALDGAVVGDPVVLSMRVDPKQVPGKQVPGTLPDDLLERADRLLALPWELLLFGDRFPVEEELLDVVREAVVEDPLGLDDEPTSPLALLALVAAPVDAVSLDREAEMLLLRQALGSGGDRLRVSDLGTLDDLLAIAKAHVEQCGAAPSALHFTGHGCGGALLFENPARHSHAVSAGELMARLRAIESVPRRIYLSACNGAGDVASQDALEAGAGRREHMAEAAAVETEPSTAAALHRAGFAQVLGYFGPVGDAQATRTAAVFYAALADGRTARAAVRAARERAVEPLLDDSGTAVGVYPLGWTQFALYCRGADIALRSSRG